MSELTRDDVIDMLKGIFEEQRDMTDEERQAYYDMLRKKERRTSEELKVGMKVKWKDKPYKIISLQNGIKLREMSKAGRIIYGALGIKPEDLEEIK